MVEQEIAPVIPLASIVITLDIQTHQLKVAGNVLMDKNLALRMILNAGATLMNEEAREVNGDHIRRVTDSHP